MLPGKNNNVARKQIILLIEKCGWSGKLIFTWSFNCSINPCCCCAVATSLNSSIVSKKIGIVSLNIHCFQKKYSFDCFIEHSLFSKKIFIHCFIQHSLFSNKIFIHCFIQHSFIVFKKVFIQLFFKKICIHCFQKKYSWKENRTTSR